MMIDKISKDNKDITYYNKGMCIINVLKVDFWSIFDQNTILPLETYILNYITELMKENYYYNISIVDISTLPEIIFFKNNFQKFVYLDSSFTSKKNASMRKIAILNILGI